MELMSIVLPLYFLLLSAPASAAPRAPAPAEPYVVECAFTNPAYSGTCGVSEETAGSVSPGRACQLILSCLNNVQCSGKTYCNATTVRGGWKLISAGRARQDRK